MKTHEEDINNPHSHDIDLVRGIETQVDENGWCRDDIPTTRVPNPDV
jgi:hypothetical protein